jgi:hypothetical protein
MTWMINHAEGLRDAAQARRNKGLHTGKAATGWQFKRPDPARGSFDRLRLEIKAHLRDHWASVHDEYLRAAYPERYDIPF